MSSSTEEKAKQNARELTEKIQDLQEGKLPSNKEIVSGIEELKSVPKNVEEQKGGQLSQTGKEVLTDTTRVLESVERLVQEKNQGELFQEAVLHAKKAGDYGGLNQLKLKLSGLVSQQEAQKAQQDAHQGVVSLITLVRLFFTSSDFRYVLFQFGDVCLDILSEKRTLRKYREELEPKSSKISGSKPISTTTTRSSTEPQKHEEEHEFFEPGQQHFQGFVQSSSQQQSGEKKAFGEKQQPMSGAGFGEYEGRTQPISQQPKHFEEEHKTTTTKTSTGTEAHEPTSWSHSSHHELSQKDAEDRLLDKFLELLPILKKRPEFRNSIRWLFMSLESLGSFLQEKQEALHEKLGGTGQTRQDAKISTHPTYIIPPGAAAGGKIGGEGQLGGGEFKMEARQEGKFGEPKITEAETPAERELHLTAENAKALVERWINRPLNPLIDLTDQLAKKFEQDQTTRELLKDIVRLVRKCIDEEGYLENNREEVRNQFVEKRDTLRNALKQKYEPIRQQLSNELHQVLDNLRSDEAVQEFSDSVRQLMNTVFLDQNGNPMFKPELIRDCQLILPSLLEKLRYIAIPKLEQSSEDSDSCFEDIVVKTSQLYPENFTVNLLANVSRDINKGEEATANFDNIISIRLHDLRATITNIRFWYTKKTGFPKLSDSGLLDIRIYGRDGLSIDLEIEPTAPSSFKKDILPQAKVSDKEPQTKIRSVKCKIHKLDLHFHETKHDFLYAVFSPFIESYLKKRVETAVEESLKNFVYKIDESIKSLPNPKELVNRAVPPPREVES